MGRFALLLPAVIAVTGCTHTQLQFNTTHQANTVNDIYRKQVLNNLAMFAEDPHAVPHFAFPNQGSSIVIDQGMLAGSFDAFRETLGFNVSRNMQESWTLDPVRDPDKLRRMRCAYQRAVGSACCDPCNDCCEVEKGFHGSGNQKIHVCGTGSPTDPLTGLPFVNEFGEPLTNPRTGEPYVLDEKGCVTIPAYDCNGPCSVKCGWFCTGRKCDVPRNCRQYSGCYHGTYVWVSPQYRHELSKLILLILDYAINDAPTSRTKEVVLYVDQLGETTTKDMAHAMIRAQILIGEPNRSILAVEKCYEKGTPDTPSTTSYQYSRDDSARVTSPSAGLPSLPSLLPKRRTDRSFGSSILQERQRLDALAPR